MVDENKVAQPDTKPEVKVDTKPEETLEGLKAELAKTKALADEKEKGFKTLQQKLAEEQAKSEKWGNVESRFQSLDERLKIMAAVLAEKDTDREDLESAPKEKKQDLLKKFDDLDKQFKEKTAMEQAVAQVRTYQKRVEDLGLTSEDEEYHAIRKLVQEGDYGYAEAKLKKLEKSKVPQDAPKEQPKQPVETEEQKLEKYGKEYAKKMGWLKTDNSSPSGGGGKLTLEDVKKMSPEERRAHRDEISKLPLTI